MCRLRKEKMQKCRIQKKRRKRTEKLDVFEAQE
jgi:hypothetical protein